MQYKYRILYIQHAQKIGGSVISLLNLIQNGMENGYECYVLCPNETIANIYKDYKINAFVSPIIPIDHNTAYYYKLRLKEMLSLLKKIAISIYNVYKIKKILFKIYPDIVHLNSSVLPIYAFFIKKWGFRVVWHIRERISKGYFGIRKNLLKIAINKFADFAIYIGEEEYRILNTKKSRSAVIYNYVNIKSFIEYSKAAEKSKDFIAITLGGISEIKGTHTILSSLDYLPKEFLIKIIGSEDPMVLSDDVLDPYYLRIKKIINQLKESSRAKFYSPVIDIKPILYECDVLIFWGLTPHFPRPIYEAWLFNKPVIVYNNGSLPKEINGNTALIINEDTPHALANGLIAIKYNYDLFKIKSEIGKSIAIDLFSDNNFHKIDSIYRGILTKINKV